MTTGTTSLYEKNDLALMQQVNLHNDYRAFEQLFHRHYNDLCQRVFALTQSRDISEEIVSDLFLKIWQKRTVLHIQTSVKAYLVRSARNAAIDYLRYVVRQRGNDCDLSGDFESNYASPHEMLIGTETQTIVEIAINALPAQGKIIFRMSRDKGMTYTEIAKSLNLSIKTVETHMGRSLKFLRQVMHTQKVF